MTKAVPHSEPYGLRAANFALRFLLELAMLVALAYRGFQT